MIEQQTSDARGELERLQRRSEKLQGLLDVGKQFGAERNVDKLLDHVLSEAARLIEADRCSLFILDEDRGELWTKIAHGLGVDEIRIPLGKGVAGQCAATRRSILIEDAYADSRFNPDIDKETGYRTRSLLAIPMLDLVGRCTGVIQALNKTDGTCFTLEDQELLFALGGQAAVALQNTVLHEEIRRLFEGFIQASVVAIESRDPTTSGHSERVAVLTVSLAEALNRDAPAPYRSLHFSEDELRELRYASLLHDFGKVGVREKVLVKANKLYPYDLELIRCRFDYARQEREIACLKRIVELLHTPVRPADPDARIAQLRAELAQELAELEGLFDFIQLCNRPTILEHGGFERLAELTGRVIVDPRGVRQSLLQAHEMLSLSVTRGSLNEQERNEIQSHVAHTFSFLEQIPWTRDLRRVPEIAAKHHEKLNGRGYPRGLAAEEIPVQSRMMAITDIYDALTAQDRPYKKAVPHEQALDILHTEARQGALDLALLGVFVEAGVFRHLRAPGGESR